MSRLPDAVFIIDTKKEHIAVTEANKLGIPIVAVVDTNCDPDLIQYVIPGNDDAIRAGTLMCRVIADAVEEGRFIASRRAARSSAAAAGPSVQDAAEEARRTEQQREARRQAAVQAKSARLGWRHLAARARPTRPGVRRRPAPLTSPRRDRAGRGRRAGPTPRLRPTGGRNCRPGPTTEAPSAAAPEATAPTGHRRSRHRRAPPRHPRPPRDPDRPPPHPSRDRCGTPMLPPRPTSTLPDPHRHRSRNSTDGRDFRQGSQDAARCDRRRHSRRKKALIETNGDQEAAAQLLREKGLVKADQRADRDATQGAIAAAFVPATGVAALVQLRSETDFVAKSPSFVELADPAGGRRRRGGRRGSRQPKDAIDDLKVTLKENIQLGRVVRFEPARQRARRPTSTCSRAGGSTGSWSRSPTATPNWPTTSRCTSPSPGRTT